MPKSVRVGAAYDACAERERAGCRGARRAERSPPVRANAGRPEPDADPENTRPVGTPCPDHRRTADVVRLIATF